MTVQREDCLRDSEHIYKVNRSMFDKLGLDDSFRNIVVAAMIYIGYGPHFIEEELLEQSTMRLMEYVSAARAFGFTADYKVEPRR